MTGSQEDYRVELDAYAGPLDLLLHLVKRHEIDLHDIPIAQLTDQYMTHLRAIETLDVERAGEFLVMAATLLEIKSKLIQPQAQAEEDGADDESPQTDDAEDALDPRYELVQQLLAYKQYKDAANYLEARQQQWASRFKVHAAKPNTQQADASDEANAPQLELELEDVNIMDLCEAFGRILNSIGESTQHEVTYDDTPIQLHAEDVADRLHREGQLTLHQLFEGRTQRSELIGLFLATLELVRDKRVRVQQAEGGGTVTLELIGENERAELEADNDAPADWTDPETGEVQYDWPDEEARQRAERRKQQRAKERFQKMRRDENDTADASASHASGEAHEPDDTAEADDVFDPSSIHDRSDDTQSPPNG